MTFFRQAALLLPSAFLIGVLVFLLTHGRDDPGFATYAFLEQWAGGQYVAAGPEARFVEQSILFFLPMYLLTLLFILFVVTAEAGIFGRRSRPAGSAYRRAFAATFTVLFLMASVALVVVGERAAARLAPGALVAPMLAACVPFGAAVAAFPFAVVLSGPVALLMRAGSS